MFQCKAFEVFQIASTKRATEPSKAEVLSRQKHKTKLERNNLTSQWFSNRLYLPYPVDICHWSYLPWSTNIDPTRKLRRYTGPSRVIIPYTGRFPPLDPSVHLEPREMRALNRRNFLLKSRFWRWSLVLPPVLYRVLTYPHRNTLNLDVHRLPWRYSEPITELTGTNCGVHPESEWMTDWSSFNSFTSSSTSKFNFKFIFNHWLNELMIDLILIIRLEFNSLVMNHDDDDWSSMMA